MHHELVSNISIRLGVVSQLLQVLKRLVKTGQHILIEVFPLLSQLRFC